MGDFFSNQNVSSGLEFPTLENKLPKLKKGLPSIDVETLFSDVNNDGSDNIYC